MPKTPPVGVRMDPELKAALERAAFEDQRSLSALISKILREWAVDNGLLRKGTKP